ncbi:MAG: ABC transporter permease subunit [Anaerolineaceae bacterium]|nr:ABC transporter permease subunit [Anaerolineaceae bacterium]
MNDKNNPMKRYLLVGLSIIVGIVIYAYGFTVTKVNLEETKSERRQTQLVRIIRALAKPNIIEYDKEEFIVETPIMVPCTDAPIEFDIDKTLSYMIVEEKCADSQAEIHIYGYSFEPYISGPLSFVPPSGVKLNIGEFTTDALGNFEIVATVPKGRESDDEQIIRAITRKNIGKPHLTETAINTWKLIIETVFMALLATTLGTLIAVPLSFFAARNLMENMKSPLLSFSLGIVLMPIGFLLGSYGVRYGKALTNSIGSNNILIAVVVILGPLLVYQLLKWAMPQVELEKPSLSTRIIRIVGLLICAFVGILVLFQISNLAILAGQWLHENAGSFAFLGKFIADLGEILNMIIIVIAVLAGMGVLNSVGSKFGQLIIKKSNTTLVTLLNYLLSMSAGAILSMILGAGVNWIYEIGNPVYVYLYPGIVGGIIGFIVAYLNRETGIMPVGMVIYYVTRTIFNALRSIEALVMAIIFVVWVGIGPFAGALALSLHTIAALAKLYSEQVESIMEGPIEAVKATGANQLQTIIYAVVPQIIPPYISFTMYRWDINVRMSTIIGFAGGGGIGFLLQQNINLLNYRDASVQMIAIAIVVASMDYISSQLRERVI